MIRQPPDPDQVADEVRELLSRPEFRYEPSLLDRFSDWVGRQLEKIFGWLDFGGGGGSATFGGGAGALVAWLIIVVAAAAVVATVIYVVRHRVRRTEREDDELVSEIEHRHPASHWADAAERHEARGEWKEALRCRYRELVRALVDRRQLADVAGRTTGELRDDLATTTPDGRDAFDRATLMFELAWYAGAPTGPEDNRAFRAAAAEVLAAPALDVAPPEGDAGPSAPGERIEVSA